MTPGWSRGLLSPSTGCWAATGALALAIGLAGCGATEFSGSAAPEAPATSASASPSATGTSAPTGPVPSARVGAAAPSTRVRFIPTSVVLSGGATAVVEPAATVDGELKVPENVKHVGWWDGSAEVGDPFGTTVIAGHVDSATEGLGFFSRLLQVKKGQVVTVKDGKHSARYRVTSVRTVKKRALATSSSAFDQLGDHRLVLITCGGAYRADRGGYDSNVVVTAAPLGSAR